MLNQKNISDFYQSLGRLKKSFKWEVTEDNKIVGTLNGNVYNPITAVAFTYGHKPVRNNKKETLKAARATGFGNIAEQVYEAYSASNNRGNTQVVRGKIREALGV
jgi:hypothetical protein